MELNEREKCLIGHALFILECQCCGGGEDLHYEIKDELEEEGGVPDPNSEEDEIRVLMKKIEDG